MPMVEKQHLGGFYWLSYFFPASSSWSPLPLCPCALWLTDTAGTVILWGRAGIPHQPKHLALQPAVWQDKIIRSPNYLQCPTSAKHRVALAEASASKGRKQLTQIINS